jgi:hypothetical protein
MRTRLPRRVREGVTKLPFSESDSAALRRLSDESEIRAVIARYARGMDRADFDLVRSCYHPDGTDAHGEYNGGIDGLLGYAGEFMKTQAVESMMHNTCQSVIELDGDRAWVETYHLVVVRIAAASGGTPMDVLGPVRYVDLFERREGIWRIAHRKVVFHPHRLDAVKTTLPVDKDAFVARMDGDDPSYDRRPESFVR